MTTAPAVSPRRHSGWVWGIAGAVVLLLIAAITGLGGFADVPEEDLAVISMGDAHHGNEVDTAVTSIYLTTRSPGQSFDADEGKQYLVVTATLTNTTTVPSIFTRDVVRVLLDGEVSSTDDPGVVDPRTGHQAGFVQPGIPLDVVYTWEVASSVTNGDDIIVGLFDRFAVDDARYSDTAYTNPTPTARILTTIGASE